MIPDTVSTLFPDRPIRPLPKRRLREKLSPEVADSIQYPPQNQDAPPLFYYPPYASKDDGSPTSDESYSVLAAEYERRPDVSRHRTPRRNGAIVDGGPHHETVSRSSLVPRSPPEFLSGPPASNSSRIDQHTTAESQLPRSTPSSLDGYDSFENTNNKKKRKIPSAGDSGLNGTHALHHDMSSLAIGSPHSPDAGDRSAGYAAANSITQTVQGMSGSGRGRLGIPRNGRSPLRTLTDGGNTLAHRASKGGQPQYPDTDLKGGGIISNAIANAEKSPLRGQENVSLLQQHSASTRTTPASSQFTFTCDSQVPSTVHWPEHPNRHNMSTQTPSLPASSATSAHQARPPATGSPKAANGGQRGTRRKSRRRLERELDAAARHRRDIAADNYFHNPPKLDDVWICEFCEYERIFRVPPRALIRNYEIKDRRHRQEEADRKRLLEKAKAKSRKGRKSGKAAAKSPGAAPAPGSASVEPLEQDGGGPMQPGHSHSTHSEEEDFDYEGDEVYHVQAHRVDPAMLKHSSNSGLDHPGGRLDYTDEPVAHETRS